MNLTFLAIGALTGSIIFCGFKFFSRRKKSNNCQTGLKKDENTLYLSIFPRTPKAPILDYSPFCTKLDMYLRASKLDYTVIRDIKHSPKGKKPYLIHQGQDISDSQLCIEYIVKTFGIDLDAHLSVEQKAIAHSLQIMLEERLYFIMIYSRWIEQLPLVRMIYFVGVPKLITYFIAGKIQRNIRNTLYLQGLGRHSREEIYGFGCQDLQAVADLLGKKKYFFNDRVSLIDMVVYSVVGNILLVDKFSSPLRDYLVNNLPDLCQYIRNLHSEYYPDISNTI